MDAVMNSLKCSAVFVLVALLLGCGSTSQSNIPATAVIDAAASGDVATLQTHIAAKVDLNVRNKNRSTPLMAAAALGQTKTAKMLIDAGAKLDLVDNEGSTALHSAAFFCEGEIVKALLAAGADKSIRNKAGTTAFDSVAGPFEEVQPIYDFFKVALGPVGLELDYARLKSERPKMAALLEE